MGAAPGLPYLQWALQDVQRKRTTKALSQTDCPRYAAVSYFATMPVKIMLYRDATLRLPLQEIADGLNPMLKSCHLSVGRELIEISGSEVRRDSYNHLPPYFVEEAGTADFAVVATKKRYENNYFYDYPGNIVILSFSGWDRLTKLPETNGFVLMIAEVLVDHIQLGKSHQQSRGCVNDFRALKTDIDLGLRAAFICEECLSSFHRSHLDEHSLALLNDIDTILNEVSAASRKNQNIVDRWRAHVPPPALQTLPFDVFLSYNAHDKLEVRTLNQALKTAGVRTWFDEDEIRPGQLFQPELELQIQKAGSAAIFVGSSDRAPWQNLETRSFLSEFADRGCPLIPVLLKTCSSVPVIPTFLKQFNWVDFRLADPDPFQRLLWGISGKKPGMGPH